MSEFRQDIVTSLIQRQRLVKIFKAYTQSKRLDFCPTTLLGWLDGKGYLNIDLILEDLAKEKEEPGDD